MNENLEMQLLVTNDDDDEELPPVSTVVQNQRKQWPYLGILLATISSLFFSLCSVIVKWMVDVDPLELAIFRFIGVLLPTVPIMIMMKADPFPQGKRLLLLVRSFVGTTGLMLSFYAFRHMPLADASVIVFSVPVFVTIFARVFLKEPIGLFNVISILLTLIGVILITRPSFIFGTSSGFATDDKNNQSSWGAIAALSATLFGACAYVLLRVLKSLHFSVVMANFGAFALLETYLTTSYMGVLCLPQCGMQRVLVIALALFSFSGQILLTLAFQLENAGPVSVARTSDIVFAFIWEILFFKQIPSIYSILGAMLVISSVLIIGLRKWIVSLPSNDPLRIKLNILIW